jgi:hypothetical protein
MTKILLLSQNQLCLFNSELIAFQYFWYSNTGLGWEKLSYNQGDRNERKKMPAPYSYDLRKKARYLQNDEH